MIRMAYRHALRATEVVSLTWDQVNLKTRELHVIRAKQGKNTTHLLNDQEIKALRKLQKESTGSDFLFMGERGTHIAERGFFKIVQQAGELAGLGHVHPHMLRHAAGYELINSDQTDLRMIQDYMGHANIANTVKYTELSSKRFKKINHIL